MTITEVFNAGGDVEVADNLARTAGELKLHDGEIITLMHLDSKYDM